MRMVGWCERCHRIRQVRVNLSRWTGRGVPVGICWECEQEQRGPR